MLPPLVKITDVRKRYGPNEVLKGVSADIGRGDVVAIIGRSSKSTLLACINGLETYQSGSIVVDSMMVGDGKTDLRDLRCHVGIQNVMRLNGSMIGGGGGSIGWIHVTKLI